MNKKSWEKQAEYHNELKRQMWLQNPRCHYCGIVTVYSRKVKGTIAPDYPTVEHIYPKTDLRRFCIGGGKKRVIACNKCNHEQGKKSHNINDPYIKYHDGLLMDIYNGLYDGVFVI